MHENEIARDVVDAAYHIHVKVGPGLLESAYETILEYELRKRGLHVERQVSVPIVYDEIVLDEGYRADLIVESKLIVEIKATEKNAPVFARQLNTYLMMKDLKLGLLINFGMPTIKEGLERVINGSLAPQ